MKLLWPSSLSLSQRLFLPMLSFVVILFIVFQTISYYKYVGNAEKNLLNRVTILATGIGTNLTAAIQFDDELAGAEILSAFKADPSITSVEVVLPNKLYPFASFQQTNSTVSEKLSDNDWQQIQTYTVNHHSLYLVLPIQLEQQTIAHMRLTVSLSDMVAMQYYQIKISGWMLLSLIVVSSLLLLRLQRWVTQPISSLHSAMLNIINNDQNQQVEITSLHQDEVGKLVSCFNTMIDKLNQREEQIHNSLTQLNNEKAFANNVIASVQHALIVTDLNGIIILANNSCSKVFGLTPNQLLQRPIISIIKPLEPLVFNNALHAALKGQQHFKGEAIRSAGNTNLSMYHIVSHPLPHKQQILFSIEDITEKSQAEANQRMAAQIFENSQDAILLLDGSGHIILVNPALCRLFGVNEHQILKRHYHCLLTNSDYHQLKRSIREALLFTQQWQGEGCIYNQKTKTKIPLFLKINKIIDKDSQETHISVVASDLSSAKEVQRLAQIAHHDALTHLPNRHHLHQHLSQLLTAPRDHNVAVLFIDLDGFKNVNDIYGHNIGDKALKIVAKKLLLSTRQNDLVARLAGDEFIVVLNQVTNKTLIEQICNRILNALSTPMNINSYHVEIGASIGFYTIPPNETTNIDDILSFADVAMYQSKIAGKGRFTEYRKNLFTQASSKYETEHE
ncbi:TPA: diguanylate cyclase domain-containing protein [Photobacterium damselae]